MYRANHNRWLEHCCFLWLLTILLLTASACDRPSPETPTASQVVRLDKLSPLPGRTEEQEGPVFRVAVAAIISPKGTAESYRPLLDVLEGRLETPVKLIQRRTYQEINNLIRDHAVDLAFICTGAYIMSKDEARMRLLAIPQVDGATTYRSFIIVPSHSGITSLAGLRNKVFAFTDPLSNTGYLYPVFLLETMGEVPERFFHRTFFTYSHDRSIQAVVAGVADGAAVDNLVYQYTIASQPDIARQTRIIHRSQEFGMPPVVVPDSIDPTLFARLQAIFLDLHNQPQGKRALVALNIDRFVPPDEALYQTELYCP